jgi:hypothetical protein
MIRVERAVDDLLSLFELQEWLDHRCPSSTQHYAKIIPTKLPMPTLTQAIFSTISFEFAERSVKHT